MTRCASENDTGYGLGWDPPVPLPLDIDTPRLTIRRYRLEDAAETHRVISAFRDQILPWVGFVRKRHLSIEDTTAWVTEMARCAAEPRGPHVPPGPVFPGVEAPIFEKATGDYVGIVCLHSIAPDTRSCELGYWIRGDREGRGYATEATRHWLTRVLTPTELGGLGFARARCHVAGPNTGSARVCGKLGLRLEVAQRHENFLPDVGVVDQLGWGVLADEWNRDTHAVASTFTPAVADLASARAPIEADTDKGLNWTPLTPVPTTIETPRLLLRPYRPEDGPEIHRVVNANREHLSTFMPWARDAHRTVEGSIAFAAEHARIAAEPVGPNRDQRPANLVLAIIERATGAIVGGTGYHDARPDSASCETGYWVVADRAGRGYVTEAMRHWISRLLERQTAGGLGFNRVRIYCSHANAASRRVCEKLGLRVEGHQRADLFVEGIGVTDRLGWGVLAAEWDTNAHRIRG